MSIAEDYRLRTPGSAQRAVAAARVMPGGDTRSATHHLPYPLTIARAHGTHVVDVDGNDYIDLSSNFTSLVHGNAYPPVIEAIQAAAARGTAWSARCDQHIALAEELVGRYDCVSSMRFTNSGTEANMLAVAVARAATGRDLVLMARHGYHGSYDDLEVGFLGHEGPRTLLADFNDLTSFEKVLANRGDEIACVILEPVMGSAGIVEPVEGFLPGVAAAAKAAGSVFILDEVICLRHAAGGASSVFGVRPDLTTFGKIIGGGLAVGAVGGDDSLMDLLDPARGLMYHSGTFNGNPMTAAAGLAALRELTPERIVAIGALAAQLRDGLLDRGRELGLSFSVRRSESLLNAYFSASPPPPGLKREDTEFMSAFHVAALNHGLFFPSRGMMVTSTVMTPRLIDEVIERAGAAMNDVVAELGAR